MKFITILLKWVLVTASMLISSLAHTETSVHTNKEKILVLGDSISAGLGVTPELAWVKQFSQPMQTQYRLQVINASVSGETSSGGRNRLPSLLKLHQPRFVIIELGGNDGLRGISTKTIDANLQDMIRQSRAAGAQVLLLGMRIPSSYGARYGEDFAAVYPRLASRNAVPLVPFLLEQIALDPSQMQADKIHPNDKGQAQILRNVMTVFEASFKHTRQNKTTIDRQ